MKNIVFAVLFILLGFKHSNAQAPVLGNYAAYTIPVAGGNGTIMPSSSPTNTSAVYASAPTNFKGRIQINPLSGQLIITNAHPAGNYNIDVKAYNGAVSSTTSFILNVGNAKCSNGQIVSATDSVLLADSPSKVYLADFNKDGNQDFLTVYGSLNVATIRLGNGSGGFTAVTDVGLAAAAYSATINDFNGDGNMDFATSNTGGTGVISIRLGNGSGGFVAASNLNVGTTSACIASCDVNGDGIPDLAIGRLSYDTVYIRLGDGSGGFTGNSKVYVAGRPIGIVFGDFNNDGKKDIASVNSSNGNVAIRLGDGLGGFSGTSQISLGSGKQLWDIALGDFNIDGKQDLVVVDNSSNGRIFVRLGDGLGGFSGTTDISTNTGTLVSPNCVAVGDFNGDGKEDLLVGVSLGNSASIPYVLVKLGDNNGNFSGGNNIRIFGSAQSLAIGDLNNDGHQDFVMANFASKVNIRLGGANNIDIQGNANTITLGDATPSLLDHTDFGNAGVVPRTFTIRNTGNLNLLINTITINGADTALFKTGNITLPKTIEPGANTTFTVTFSPKTSGIKTATVAVGSDDCTKPLYNFAVQGNGSLPTIGSYNSPSAIVAGGNIVVPSSTGPINISAVTASTNNFFKGILTVDPLTGSVIITDAHPAGTYNIKVKAFNGLLADTSSFQLTINKNFCNQALFGNATIATAAAGATGVAIGDFDGDGKQDFATANATANNVSIRLGNGAGTFSGTTQIAVGTRPQSIAIADFNGDGKQDFVTANSSVASASVRYGDGLGGFAGTTEVTVGLSPYWVATGDFNADGRMDFATANYASSTVSVVLSNASGGFNAATSVGVGSNPYSMALGDFNKDGRMDIISASTLGNTVSVRLGSAADTFSVGQEMAVGSSPRAIALGDFNSDGRIDFVTANYNSNTISFAYGDTIGGFYYLQTRNVSNHPTSVTTGDFNGDGLQDIAVMCNNSGAYNGKLYFYLNDGEGNFAVVATEAAVNSSTGAIGVGDFNADGKLDFLAANAILGAIHVGLGGQDLAEINLQGNNTNIIDGDLSPSFSDSTDFGINGIDGTYKRNFSMQNLGTSNIMVRNITITGPDASSFLLGGTYFPNPFAGGNSRPFIINFKPTTTGAKSAVVHIYSDDCDEAVYDFAVQGNAVLPTLGNYPVTTALAGSNVKVIPSVAPTYAPGSITAYTTSNFKGILTVNPSTGVVSVTNAQPAGTFLITVRSYNVTTTFILKINNAACTSGALTKTENISVAAGCRFLAVGDFNNDGNQDFVTAGTTLSIRLGDGAGSFYTNNLSGFYSDVYFVTVGDFNGDGNQDLAIPVYTFSGTVSILLGDGQGNFTNKGDSYVGDYPYAIAVADFNGDGKQDMAIANSYLGNVSVKLGVGTGEFTGSTLITTGGTSPRSIVAGDFDGDGNQDFAVANYSSNFISIRKGNGAGGFVIDSNVNVGTNPQALFAADMNADGKTDLLTANYTAGTVSVCFGNGSAGFLSPINVVVAPKPVSIIVGDFNGDGIQDFATTSETGNVVSVRLGDGLGSFTQTADLAVESKPVSLGIGDFNADGKQDIAVLNTTSSNVSILLALGEELQVAGNNLNIVDGDSIPDNADNTHFGNILFTDSTTRNFTVTNVGNDTLTIHGMDISGIDSALFSISSLALPITLAPADSVVLRIKFLPLTSGLKVAKINILSSDCDESIFDFTIQGLATPSAVTLDFDGVDDFIDINTTVGNIDTSNATISAWIKTTSTVPSSIMSKRNTCVAGNFFDLGISSVGNLSFDLNNGAIMQSVRGTKIVNNGVWHHVAVVRKDSIVDLYVDGILDTAMAFSTVVNINNNAALMIGATGCNGSSRFFKGVIDDVRIWSKALSAPSLQNSMLCELSNMQTGLIAYYKFNQGIALGANQAVTSLTDVSGKGNNGTLHNFALVGITSNWIAPGAISTGSTCSNINVWRGVSSDWSLASNWSLGIVPFEETSVVINAGVPFMPEVTDANSLCYSLRLTNGAIITIKGTGKLNVIGK